MERERERDARTHTWARTRIHSICITHMYPCLHTYIHACERTHKHKNICKYVCMHVCMYQRGKIYMHLYTCKHAHPSTPLSVAKHIKLPVKTNIRTSSLYTYLSKPTHTKTWQESCVRIHTCRCRHLRWHQCATAETSFQSSIGVILAACQPRFFDIGTVGRSSYEIADRLPRRKWSWSC